eukprot:CAMPEP_0177651796 /NCGR_PEP_ID=MMETSP0447-20121125/12751_1 /TAXON_ID=0 /ORGANISM="Stygamoeba regulata, Strain BSH-02190019" /LENGTH=473 /DNA_ID=CAMNT_0019154925 /DNA_START=30 /DNA_END=1451 /DNA_ORIENTATION=-
MKQQQKTGYLREWVENQWKRRFFSLKDGSLSCYKSKQTFLRGEQELEVIALSGLNILRGPNEANKKNCFRIVSGTRDLAIITGSEQEINDWVEALTGVVEPSSQAPQARSGSSFRSPVRKQRKLQTNPISKLLLNTEKVTKRKSMGWFSLASMPSIAAGAPSPSQPASSKVPSASEPNRMLVTEPNTTDFVALRDLVAQVVDFIFVQGVDAAEVDAITATSEDVDWLLAQAKQGKRLSFPQSPSSGLTALFFLKTYLESVLFGPLVPYRMFPVFVAPIKDMLNVSSRVQCYAGLVKQLPADTQDVVKLLLALFFHLVACGLLSCSTVACAFTPVLLHVNKKASPTTMLEAEAAVAFLIRFTPGIFQLDPTILTREKPLAHSVQLSQALVAQSNVSPSKIKQPTRARHDSFSESMFFLAKALDSIADPEDAASDPGAAALIADFQALTDALASVDAQHAKVRADMAAVRAKAGI